MNIFKKIVTWWKGLFNQEVEGYVCPREDNNPHAINEKILYKFNVKKIKFNIPFLDPQNHWCELYFIPKMSQQDLDFLPRLVRVLPITCIFKKRILQGFKRKDFDLIEIWSRNAYDEIKNEALQSALVYEEEQMKIEQEKAAEVAAKVEAQRKAKEEEKERKREEKERLKAEAKAAKLAEKEAKKQAKEKEKENKNK